MTDDCAAPATQAIDWGERDDGGTHFACDDHATDVYAYLAAFEGGAYDSDFDGNGSEVCDWDPSMRPDAIAETIAVSAARKEAEEQATYAAWLELGAPGGPAETVASCRAAVGDEALITLLRYARRTDTYDLVPYGTQ